MKFSGKIEDGTSNQPLNFGSDPDHGWSTILDPMIQKAEEYSGQEKIRNYRVTNNYIDIPKGRQFDTISDPAALAEVCTLRVLLVLYVSEKFCSLLFFFYLCTAYLFIIYVSEMFCSLHFVLTYFIGQGQGWAKGQIHLIGYNFASNCHRDFKLAHILGYESRTK